MRVDLKSGRETVALKAGHPGMRWASLSADARWIASGAWHNPSVKIFDADSGEMVKNLTTEDMSSVAFSPDGKWLVIGGKDYQFLEVGTWEVKWRLQRPFAEGFPPAMTFSGDGRILALCHTWRNVRLIDMMNGDEIATLEAPKPWQISSLSFNHDASSLAVGGENTREFHLWNLRLIRQQLSCMSLDWNLPPYPTQDPALTNSPPQVIVRTNSPINPPSE